MGKPGISPEAGGGLQEAVFRMPAEQAVRERQRGRRLGAGKGGEAAGGAAVLGSQGSRPQVFP